MTSEIKVETKPKIVVIGGGSGQPIILKGLKQYDAELTAVITVADDGGSSGTLRDYLDIIPPGDVRNVMAVMSNVSPEFIDVFQYRFKKEDEMLAGHALGNLVIAAMAEKENDIFRGVQILSHLMNVDGHIYPVANEPLVLYAKFKDGTELSGEAEITAAHKVIDHIWVTPQDDSSRRVAQAPSEVINAILNADEIVLGPGSLYTSVLPNLVVDNVREALKLTPAKIIYIANIMTQKGETDGYSEADHVRAINDHIGSQIVDAVIMNTDEVPDNYIDWQKWNEVSTQVASAPEEVRKEGAVPITGDLLELRDDGAFHDGDAVAKLIMQIATGPDEK